jgi:hypothetical protein
MHIPAKLANQNWYSFIQQLLFSSRLFGSRWARNVGMGWLPDQDQVKKILTSMPGDNKDCLLKFQTKQKSSRSGPSLVASVLPG